MRPKSWLKAVVTAIAVVGVVSLLAWGFVAGRKKLAQEQEQERPIKAPARVSVEDGSTVVTLDKVAQSKAGIIVAPLKLVSRQEQVEAYGTILPLQGLMELQNRYIAAKAKVDTTRAALEASRKEYDRLKVLHENQNISAKVFQAAEARWRSDAANASAAEEALHALEGAVRQRWGGVLAKGLFGNSPAFNRLVQQEDVLIQITLPLGKKVLSAPKTASVQTEARALAPAKLVSLSPQTDPRIQGKSFFYIAPSGKTGLVPGMNVLAYLPNGSQLQGVIVPSSAVVWWQGKAWVYAQRDSDRFVRREVSTEAPAKEGWFISKALSEGERIVVRGAQLLLSEEFRAQIQVGD